MNGDRIPYKKRGDEPRHPSYDPSGTEPAGSSDGLPDRSFAAPDTAESEKKPFPGDQADGADGEGTAPR